MFCQNSARNLRVVRSFGFRPKNFNYSLELNKCLYFKVFKVRILKFSFKAGKKAS